MSIPVVSDAAAMAAALLDVAALIEEAGAAGLAVTCSCDRARILVTSCAGSARHRAALLAALGERAGAARCRQCDIAGERPAVWLEAAGRAGSTVVEVTTPLAVRSVPGGTMAAGPDGQQAVIAAGQQPPPGWRWVTELDDQPGEQPGRRQEAA
jgi:hypothetical protein